MDLEKVKEKLRETLAELEQRAEGIERNLAAPPNPDWEENAKESEDDEVLGKLGDITVDEIHHVKLALNRIDNGSYGICIQCQAKIAPERLEALPYATECINCA